MGVAKDRQFKERQFTLGSKLAPEWPARSPDLNPLDFCFWGLLKQRVYHPKPTSLDELKANIEREVSNLDPELIKRACGSLKKRCEKIISQHGGYVE